MLLLLLLLLLMFTFVLLLQVRETRNWVGHGSGRATVGERLRAMQSLMDMLGIIGPVVLPALAVADQAIACIQHHVECVESACPGGLADLSVEFHACLIFMRALELLRVRYISLNPECKGEITDIIEKIRRKMRPEQQIACNMVRKGRHYVFHGADMRRSLALLQCTCAVAQLLRFLASQSSGHATSRSSKGGGSDAVGGSDASGGSATPKTPCAVGAKGASRVECEAADACDASVVLLMQRMRIADFPSLIKETVANHDDM